MKRKKEFYCLTGIVLLVTLGLMLLTALGFAGQIRMHWILWIFDILMLVEMMFCSAICICLVDVTLHEGKETSDDRQRI